MADNGAITLNGVQSLSLFRNVTGAGSQIKLRGCHTRQLADTVEDLLGNGTAVYGAERFTINIPGTPYAIGVYH